MTQLLTLSIKLIALIGFLYVIGGGWLVLPPAALIAALH